MTKEYLSWWPVYHCHMNNWLFYHNTEFYIVTYNECLARPDKYEVYVDWLRQILGSVKMNYYDIQRGCSVDNELKDMRLRNMAIKDTIHEINYIYQSTCKMFCLSVIIPYSKAITSQDKLMADYEVTKEYLTESGMGNMINNLDVLRGLNYLYLSKAETVKSIDFLIKQIRNYEKQKTS